MSLYQNYTGYLKNRTLALGVSVGLLSLKTLSISKIFQSSLNTKSLQPSLNFINLKAYYATFASIIAKCPHNRILRISQTAPQPFFLLGILNSRNTSWGCKYTIHWGQMIDEFLRRNTYFLKRIQNVSKSNSSAIDLTITNVNSSTSFDCK
ncbi:putative RNA-directed DNA polymerase [Aphis craccivora]|uniref:Putative RNA-directed DNA polymerase n=1 Tax=Aphis craccivora TaxID=307492 RepID=A0A6G0ZKB8_APHCR|nr:putative RNA-directed DNA polymerase [Aphis craccivora]